MVDATLDKINKFIPEKWRWVLAHGGFRKYFKNTGWMFLARIAGLAFSFITIVLIARKLGPENYGQLSYAVSFIGIFSFIASLGLDTILFRDLIKYPEKKNQYLGSALTIKFISGFFAMLLVLVFAFLFTKNDVSRILIFILSGTFVLNSFQIIQFDFQAKIKSKYPAIISLLITFILSILKIVAVYMSKGVIYLALILLFESILYIIFYWIAYEKIIREKIFNFKFDKKIARQLLVDSLPLIFVSAFGMIYSRIDQVFIKNMLNAHSVGIYDSAVRIAELWYFIPGIIISSLLPAIINAKKKSEELYFFRLKKIAILLFFIAIFISVAVTIFASFIMNIVYGEMFVGGTLILKIYVWASVGTFLGILVDNYLVTENLKKILVYKSFIPMILNIILNLIWIPKYGIIGAAYATLIAYSLGPLILLFFRKTRKVVINII